jgi:hypothetical protein
MPYMDQKDAFAPAGGIQDLSFDEIDAVAGGPAPALIYFGGLAVGFGFAALADYLDGGFND